MLRYAVECSFLFVGALLRGRAVEFRNVFPLGAAHRRVGERGPVELSFFFVLREFLKKTGNLVD